MRRFGILLAATVWVAPLLIAPAAAQEAAENPTPNLSHDRHRHHHNPPHGTVPPSDSRFFTTRSSQVVLPLPEEKDAFVFAVFGDRTGGPPKGVDILADAVRDVNLIEPDLVMTVGDLINGYNRQPEWMVQMREFKSIMNELLCPWFPVAGNHDVYWRPLDDPDKPFSEHDEDYEMHFGPLWYSFQHKRCNFIVLYSDEGNPETGEKNFSKPASQQISDEQFAFLQAALERGQASAHQFIFLHHPRWLGRGYGKDWKQRVHPLLKEAGNVTAVFAGHIHQMRYDPADGIEYVTLATVGGGQSGKLPEAGYLHQYHLVTVRPEQVAMAAFPVGEAMNVREITADLQQQMGSLASQQVAFDRPLPLTKTGCPPTTVTAVVSNPVDRPVDFTLTASSGDSRWRVTPDHVHGRLEPGERREMAFRISYSSPHLDEAFRGLEFVLDQDYLSETTRYMVPESWTPAPFELAFEPGKSTAPNRALAVDGENDSVAIDSSRLALPAGPFTAECWFKADRYGDRVGLLTKTEGSEFGLFASEGRLTGSVHLNGKYRAVKSPEPTPPGKWTHV